MNKPIQNNNEANASPFFRYYGAASVCESPLFSEGRKDRASLAPLSKQGSKRSTSLPHTFSGKYDKVTQPSGSSYAPAREQTPLLPSAGARGTRSSESKHSDFKSVVSKNSALTVLETSSSWSVLCHLLSPALAAAAAFACFLQLKAVQLVSDCSSDSGCINSGSFYFSPISLTGSFCRAYVILTGPSLSTATAALHMEAQIRGTAVINQQVQLLPWVSLYAADRVVLPLPFVDISLLRGYLGESHADASFQVGFTMHDFPLCANSVSSGFICRRWGHPICGVACANAVCALPRDLSRLQAAAMSDSFLHAALDVYTCYESCTMCAEQVTSRHAGLW